MTGCERIYIGTPLTLITEQNGSGPGSYIRGVEFDGVTGMTGREDRDWPALDPAFGLARRLGCEGIWFKHKSGAEFVKQGAESAQRCRELANGQADDRSAQSHLMWGLSGPEPQQQAVRCDGWGTSQE